jgi:hypothetical protein
MAQGFIYVVKTATRRYEQRHFHNVPTEWNDRLYFGACKVEMRPKMQPGDYIFGISPAGQKPRRIVFIAKIEDRITFAEAYERFPELRGPEGPIHVQPINRSNLFFPCSHYEHIPGATHCGKKWERDLPSRNLDAFFVCSEPNGCCGRWLGASGPTIDEEMLSFLKQCSVHGSRRFSDQNTDATVENPVCYGGLYKGLHLETDEPEVFLDLCSSRWPNGKRCLEYRPMPSGRTPATRGCL